MSYVTPMRCVTRGQRASESKRALFQQPGNTSVPRSREYNADSSDDSCDLGIMSTIDTDSSDEQNVPNTCSLWRSGTRRLRSSDRKKTVKEILKSPLTFRNYSSRQSSASSRITDFLADTESCSSSLKDLRFHSDDSEMSDATGKTPTSRKTSKSVRRYPLRNYDIKNKENNKKAMKSLNFEQVIDLPDEIMDTVQKKVEKSPLKMLKTPHENNTNTQTPPRIHHKSLKESEKSTDSEQQNKSSRVSIASVPAPKARLSLFGSGEITLSPKSFYPKASINSSSDAIDYHNTTWPSNRHSKSHRHMRYAHKKSRKRQSRGGEINKGVWHGIHKPKPKAMSREKALNMALKIIENSKLNNYIDKFMNLDKNKEAESGQQNAESNKNTEESIRDVEIEKDIQQVNQTLKQFGCDVSVDSMVHSMAKVQEMAATFQVNKPIDLKKSLLPPKPVYDLNRSLLSNRSYDLNQSFDSINRSTDLNMSFTESEMTIDDNESVMSDFETASSRKIFKARTNESRKAVLKMRNLKLEIDNGKIHMPAKRQQPSNEGIKQIWNALESKMSAPPIHLDASDLLSADEDEEDFRIPNMNAIESLLSQWNEEDVPQSEPQRQSVDNNTQIQPNNLLTQQHNSVASTGNINNFENSTAATHNNVTESTNQRLDSNSSNSSSPVKDDPFDSLLSSETDSTTSSAQMEVSNVNDKKRKLYPIFDKDAVRAKQAKYEEGAYVSISEAIGSTGPKFLCTDKDQYIIDAGQKNIGVTQCVECGVIYHMGDPGDERDHMIHHTGLSILKFTGWKKERICGTWGSGRVVVVQSGDSPNHWRKVTDLLEGVVHPQLGYAAALNPHQTYKVYLYVENKLIIGCLVAEVIDKAFKMLPGTDFISSESYPIKCGISRLWTHVNHRRQNIASRMVDCVRASFYQGVILSRVQIAFSAPTPSGKAFAQKYTQHEDFWVYLDTDVS